jgi:hypothetical protein
MYIVSTYGVPEYTMGIYMTSYGIICWESGMGLTGIYYVVRAARTTDESDQLGLSLELGYNMADMY